MKYLLILLTLWATTSSAQSVFFGERNVSGSSTALYFDKEGNLYPDYFIPDTSLMKSNSSLSEWYSKHPVDFQRIAADYNCRLENCTDSTIQILNDTIISRITNKINNLQPTGNSISFLIHGFRKPYKDLPSEYSSPEDFQKLETSMSKFLKTPTTYVEVYWDGMYGCCFGTNPAKNTYLFQLFEQAQNNASRIARNFRRVLCKIKTDNVNIITHSLGAKIATEALFNHNSAFAQIPTPSNRRINICLIAPAIDGLGVFKDYYNRKTPLDYKNGDNYHVAIVYNENDFVLLKGIRKLFIRLGPGPFKHGITTLGCNYKNEAVKLKTYFQTNYPKSNIELIDVSAKVGTCHYLGACYSARDNLKALAEFMEK